MMNIAYLDPYAEPDTRVASLQILQNVDAFARRGATLQLVTPAASVLPEEILGRALHTGATQHGLRNIRKTWYFPFNSQRIFFQQARRWLKNNPVDAIFTRNLKLADFLLRHVPEVPLFFETHELFAQSFAESHDLTRRRNRKKHRILMAREQFIYQQAAGIFALTSLLADDITAAYGTPLPVIIAPDGVDRIAANEVYREALWQPHAPARILYLGSLHPWKGVPTIIEAMQHMDQAVLTIAGGNEKEIAALKEKTTQQGLGDRVRFAGYAAPKSRFALIAEHDICVLPLTKTSIGSRYTSPLKLFEYMAMNKPIVLSDLPSVREVVDESCVFFARSGDASSFAEGLRAVLSDLQAAGRVAGHARQRALTHTWDTRAETILRTITERLC